ncbi:30S ribosomal protein S3 [Pontiella sulfatireligans]|uniref:Small ribosomal subunit protein uS3 n=1 Tax=Pontiella sulfatireligans TaxID=2750658 RepID=A0A6C2UJZ6_9BACT|nr:30S ribosomal protein S3 [Pontiella sulfatireligans]VGO20545.1 30S ribosomal protein S3 [Pontiella sulfatireligans]
MGQKVNPIGMRLALTKDWRSRWYADKRDFGAMLKEDVDIRKLVAERLKDAAVSDIYIERYANRIRVTIKSARPGLVIGRKGEDIDKLREVLSKITKKEIYIEIAEVKKPDMDATLVAANVAMQLERRVSHRRAMKRALQMAMDNGALGIKILASGRLNGAEIARSESYKEGMIPLHTLRANIDYGTAEANTIAGIIGIKVWVCKEAEKKA